MKPLPTFKQCPAKSFKTSSTEICIDTGTAGIKSCSMLGHLGHLLTLAWHANNKLSHPLVAGISQHELLLAQ